MYKKIYTRLGGIVLLLIEKLIKLLYYEYLDEKDISYGGYRRNGVEGT